MSQNQKLTLTEPIARNAPKGPKGGSYFLRDTVVEGLALRIYGSGAKSWVAEKKQGKGPLRHVLGKFPDMTVHQARTAAKPVLVAIGQGVNPRLEKKQKIRENQIALAREALTVGVAWDRYVEQRKSDPKSPSQNTIKGWDSARKKLVKGDLWKTPLSDVTGEALADEYDRLAKSAKAKTASNGGKTQAAAAIRYLRAAFIYAVATGKVQDVHRPFILLGKLRKGWNQPTKRNRIVGQHEGELSKWWAAVEELRTHEGSNRRAAPMIADFLLLALLWGGRKTEILSLKWEQVDFQHGVVQFVETKNNQIHEFPMTTYARQILEGRKKDCDENYPDSCWVFPSPRMGYKTKERGHISEPKKTIAQVVEKAGCKFSPHDLRRTFGTLLNEMGVNGYTIRKALNHAAGDTAGRHYLQSRLHQIRITYQSLEDKILMEAGVKQAMPDEVVSVDFGTYQQLLAQQKELAAMKELLAEKGISPEKIRSE